MKTHALIAALAILLHAIAFGNISTSPLVKFARAELRKDCSGTEKAVDFKIDEHLPPQSFRFARNNDKWTILGGDERGLMYGGLELAEILKLGLMDTIKIGEVSQPYIQNRGIKFNVPLDARTPSYDDSGDAAQQNIAVVWDFSFWKELFDHMARHRFNTITLWNPHPFPSMVKLEDYPEVALNDVCVTTLTPSGYENEWGEPGLVSKNVLGNLKTIKNITIENKIRHWTNVFNYANERGIDIYFYNWNICPNSVATAVEPFYKTYRINMHQETPGKYGITHQLDNQETIRYYRQSVKQFLLTYPQIKGIGVTAGEHMPLAWKGYNREQWLWETYGLGIVDAKKEQPNRIIPFVHRVWHSDMDQIMKYWNQYPDPFSLSFKYAKARLYSHPDLPFVDSHIEETAPYGLKSWWNLRNDDIFVYRWGDQDYVKAFVLNLPIEHTEGTHMGSDGYVWGRVFNSKKEELSDQLEIEKHWFRFMLWGRISFDPTIDESIIKGLFLEHFKQQTDHLYLALKAASKGIPLINTFHWNDWDHNWSVESCQARPKLGGFHTVFDFAKNRTMESSGMLSPNEYALIVSSGEKPTKKVPFEISSQLRSYAKSSGSLLERASENDTHIETTALVDDVRALNALSHYYADKIDAATYLALYEAQREMHQHQKSIEALESAIYHWRTYQKISEKNYYPQHLARVRQFDWSELLEQNIKDLEELKKLR